MKYKKLNIPLRKRTTQQAYKIILANHIFPAFGDKQLVDVTGEDVQEFVTGKLGSGLAWNTVKKIISVFQAKPPPSFPVTDRKSTPLNSPPHTTSYSPFSFKKKTTSHR